MAIIVMLLGTLVYVTFVKKSEPAVVQQTTTPTQTSVSQDKNYLTIKEWGVQFEKPANMNDLQYIVINNTDAVAFTTKQLIDLDTSTGGKYCTAEEDSIGRLSRVQNFDSFIQDGRNIPSDNVRVDNYFYFFSGPQSVCSTNAQVGTLQSKQARALDAIILKSLRVTDGKLNLEIYTNSKHNYSFKYPKSWLLSDSPNSIIPDHTADDIAFNSYQGGLAEFGVRVTTPSNCSNLNDCVNNNRMSFGQYEQTTEITSITIGGRPALTETIGPPASGNWKYYIWYVLREGKLYTLFTISLDANDAVIKPTFDQILSTFEFTN